MKRNTLKLLTLSALSLSGLLPLPTLAAAPIPVVASFSILGDLVQVVGGARVQVTTLVGPNADAHSFEPRPADARAVLKARLFVINGLNFEPWAEKLAKSAAYQGAMVVASRGVKPLQLDDAGDSLGHHHADPHAWQNPDNVVLYVQNIAAGLSRVDPAGADTYQANAARYAALLKDFDAQARAQFAALPASQRKVITSHDAFGYFAAHYQIQFLAPEGVNADTTPSAKHVAELIRQMKREKIKAVFVENMSNPKLIAQISKDAGATLGGT
ncbi:metal ABC transporter solute-binding protein, Zn/Mn family, partial [Rhodoferax sp.]|uniref:metal ABC transporter solute-binding protein, Zn/Mn family n=1 Tax=Rhodoferax sp. TaxID=50421 RepID=UPI003BB66852